LVLGSESQGDTALVEALRNDARIILSLDFRGDQFLGPRGLLERPEFWPERIISMTLARVGTGSGPDFERFGEISRQAGGKRIYLAGGLRGRDDALAAKACGAAGILVASALHDGRLSRADLADFG
jgi:phosphoribosylformimino-5-aminoimidazole carboxamide ribotide isomerase